MLLYYIEHDCDKLCVFGVTPTVEVLFRYLNASDCKREFRNSAFAYVDLSREVIG